MAGSTGYINKKMFYSRTFDVNRSRLFDILSSLFGYDFPERPDILINQKKVENDLMTKGQAALFWEEKFGGFINTSCTGAGSLDINGYPTKYECVGIGYNRTMPRDKIVVIYNTINAFGFNNKGNNIVGTIPLDVVDYYATMLTNVDVGINNEINNSKNPALIVVNDKNFVKSAREAFRQADDGEPVVIADKELYNGIDTKVFTFSTETHIADRQSARRAILDDFFAYFGIDSLINEKSERMIVSEATANIDSLSLSLQNMLYPRMEGMARFERLFGIKARVYPRFLNAAALYGDGKV